MRILAIDYGDVHTGAAVSDEGGLMAWHSEVITTRKRAEVLRRLGGLIEAYQIDELVLGYPLNMDGTAGVRAERRRRFPKSWRKHFPSLSIFGTSGRRQWKPMIFCLLLVKTGRSGKRWSMLWRHA